MKSFFQSLFICLILLTGSHYANAQAFDEKTKLINVGAKFWSTITPIYLNAEFAVSSNVGIGAQVWYASQSFTNTISLEYITPGAFVNYHFPLNESKFDPYIGAGFNYFIVSVSPSSTLYGSSDHTTYGNFQGGGRYYVSEKFALNAHLDLNFGNITVGNRLVFSVGGSFKF